MSEAEVNPDGMKMDDLSVEHREQFMILVNAFAIYLDRDKARGDLWRSRPPSHKLMMIEEKVDRIKAALDRINNRADHVEGSEEAAAQFDYLQSLLNTLFDDALDIINFAVFVIREVREGQFG